MPSDQRLQRLLETYEHAVQTLRDAIALLNNGAPVTFRLPSFNGNGNGRLGHGGDRTSATYRQAARLDKKRREITATYVQTAIADAKDAKPKRKSKKRFTDRLQAQRTVSAKLLDQFDHDDPKRSKDIRGQTRGIGSLLRRGYLAKKGGGYVRTDKPFSINPNA